MYVPSPLNFTRNLVYFRLISSKMKKKMNELKTGMKIVWRGL